MIELPLWPSLALPRCGDSATPYLARAEAVSGGGMVALLVSASVRQAFDYLGFASFPGDLTGRSVGRARSTVIVSPRFTFTGP